jgi:hypothetical protein
VSRLYIEAAQTVWTATFSDDYESITTGALYGVILREEAENRPITVDSLSCVFVCSQPCTGITRLAGLLDCNGAQLGADANGDGVNDGYRLILSFTSRRVEPPVN